MDKERKKILLAFSQNKQIKSELSNFTMQDQIHLHFTMRNAIHIVWEESWLIVRPRCGLSQWQGSTGIVVDASDAGPMTR